MGQSANRFAILGRAARAAEAAGWPKIAIVLALQSASSGDYDHMVLRLSQTFDIH